MHGGSRLLVYGDGQGDWRDEDREFDGIGCRLWRHRRLGMHSRDLYQLANVLDGVDGGDCDLDPLIELQVSASS